MRILLSWIAFNNDMKQNARTGQLTGPTLAVLRNHSFDVLHLFSNDEASQKRASLLRTHVLENRREFRVSRVELEFLSLPSPADYMALWEKLPARVENLLQQYAGRQPEVYINLAAGTPAMSSTWIMMVGSGQLQASLLNPQIKRSSDETTIEQVDLGVYPFVQKIRETSDRRLGVAAKYPSPAMQQIMRELTILAQAMRRPVLILGETGTGKTSLAKQFHEMTGKPHDRFCHVVCGEFRGADLNMVKSQLFGHEKGAYTGANSTVPGVLSDADGGTVLLDEIGDIPLEAQRLLIDAVESKRYRALGSSNVKHSDFQLICATNRDVHQMILANQLSQDFHYRISSFTYTLPPLRERPEDLPVILEELLKADNYQDLKFEESARGDLVSRFQQAHLPGNIRDIQRILDHLNLRMMKRASPLSQKDIAAYFEENKEPTQDERFIESLRELLQQWPQTQFAANGAKWRDTVLDIAIGELAQIADYRKKNGGLNIYKICIQLGVDHKTIKSRVSTLGLT